MQRLKRLRRGAAGRQAFVLYLDSHTWEGQAGVLLAGTMGEVLRAGFPLLLLHECDPQRGRCEFSRFFAEGAHPLKFPSPLTLLLNPVNLPSPAPRSFGRPSSPTLTPPDPLTEPARRHTA